MISAYAPSQHMWASAGLFLQKKRWMMFLMVVSVLRSKNSASANLLFCMNHPKSGWTIQISLNFSRSHSKRYCLNRSARQIVTKNIQSFPLFWTSSQALRQRRCGRTPANGFGRIFAGPAKKLPITIWRRQKVVFFERGFAWLPAGILQMC